MSVRLRSLTGGRKGETTKPVVATPGLVVTSPGIFPDIDWNSGGDINFFDVPSDMYTVNGVGALTLDMINEAYNRIVQYPVIPVVWDSISVYPQIMPLSQQVLTPQDQSDIDGLLVEANDTENEET